MKASLRWITWAIACATLLLVTTRASAVLVVVTNGLTLSRFDSASPGTVTTVPVSGMQPGEQLVGIDFRPSNGVLYGLGNTKRLYALNFNSGVATQIGPVGTYNLSGGTFGTSINAVDDVLRFVNNESLSVRINLDTGALIGQDGGLAAFGTAAAAYTNGYADATVTTLYGLNSIEGTLVRIGPEIAFANDFNTGAVNEIGSLNLSTGLNQTMGFDIAPNGVALAAITFAGESRLYTINLNTGQAVLNGPIGGGATPYRGLAIRKGPETFANSGVILLPAVGGTGGPGFEKANPYPSLIAISGLSLPVHKLKVTLNDFRHTFPDDVDMLLFAPSQVGAPQQKMIIWSDVGGGNSTCGSNCNNGANLGTQGPTITLDDEAVASLSDNSLLTSGSFKPTNFGPADPFPAPAPVPPYTEAAPAGSDTLTSVFKGVGPNGIWSLYVVDDDDVDTGRIFGGWNLEVTSAPPCQITCPGNVTVNNSPNQCGAFVFHARPTISGACGTLVSSPASGSFFPIGTTTVTTTTSTGQSCTFNVTVNETQNPTIACNANITKPADFGQNSTVVNFDPPTVSDNCPGVTGVYSPASGSFFALGTTTVTGTATDAVGHTATCTFTVTVTPNGGPSPTPTTTPGATATPGPTSTPALPPSYLANISTRLRVESGDNVLIGGFIITGSQPKRLIVRAIGSSLPLGNRLANPKLELYSGNNLLETNDNWQDAPNVQDIIATQLAPTSDLESAILRTLNPGAYTAIVSGVNGGTGVALVETYDLSPDINSKLANIATRGFVQTGDDIMIAGTIVVGQVSQRVVVRGIGPSLPLAGKLENPTLELRDGSGTLLAENNDWRDTQEVEIVGTGLQPTNELESAIVRVLPPALYTALLRGVNGTTGIAVVEVYAID